MRWTHWNSYYTNLADNRIDHVELVIRNQKIINQHLEVFKEQLEQLRSSVSRLTTLCEEHGVDYSHLLEEPAIPKKSYPYKFAQTANSEDP